MIPKFRAWFKEEKKMYGVHELSFYHGNIISVALCNLKTLERPYFYFDIEDIELIQYTGHNDKNGVEIYKNDIVATTFNDYKYIVIWDSEYSSYRLQNITFNWDILELTSHKLHAIEVIGNIYENPELIGEK